MTCNHKTIGVRADFYAAVMAEKRRGESVEGCLIRLLGNKIKLEGEQK